MEQKVNDTCEINSFDVVPVVKANSFDWNKKRKLHVEQLGLPLPKHKCPDRDLPREGISIFHRSSDLPTFGLMEKATAVVLSEESAKDSNSITEDSSSTMSMFGDSEVEAESLKACPYDRPSSLTITCDGGSHTNGNQNYHVDGSAVMKKGSAGAEEAVAGGDPYPYQQDDGLDEIHNLEERIREFERRTPHECGEYKIDDMEQFTDKEFEDFPYFNMLKPKLYVLSSGRLIVNEEDQSGSRQATIDQEFEQYFSTLML